MYGQKRRSSLGKDIARFDVDLGNLPIKRGSDVEAFQADPKMRNALFGSS
jgi:hypothetical protein